MKRLGFLFIVLLVAGFYYSGISQQQPDNPGFEEWENAGTVKDEPVNWSSLKTSDNDITNQAAPVVWDISEDFHSGNHSVYLENKEAIGLIVTGILTNGRVHAEFNPDSGYVYTQRDDSRWHTAFTARPDSLAGWFKFYPVDNDRGRIRAILHIADGSLPPRDTEENWVADAEYTFPPDTVDTWTRFSVPFNYYNDWTPEYILLVLNSGYGKEAIEGSKALFDDIELIYNDPGSVNEEPPKKYQIYYFDNKIYFKDIPPAYLKGSRLILIDLSGQIVYENDVKGQFINLEETFQKGVYIGKLMNKNRIITQKMFIY